MERRAVSGIGLALLLGGILSLAFGIQPVRTNPTTIIVPDDYPTIQEAINAANPTDIIFVHSGTYYERVVANKSVSLIGENKDTTIIDGNKTRDVIEVRADNVVISGFTIQNGGRNGSEYGRGIWIQDCNSANITGNVVSHNTYGIWLHTSDYSTVIDNVITANDGAGVFWWNNNGTIILHNNISDNAFDGVIMKYVTYSAVRENTITANNQSGIALDDSSLNVITMNTISNNDDGIESFYSSNNIISGNNISANAWSSISLDLASNNNITRNSLTNNGYGINFINGSSNNIFYHNKFTNNTQQVYDASWDYPNVPPSMSIWDDDYPSGGNYWSDHVCTGNPSDGSQPYVIDTNNIDHYPFQDPNGWLLPPVIAILSPENKTYTTRSVPLSFTVDESTSWISYSLDGQANTTIAGNTTLTGLSDGMHSLIVYASDLAGNVGSSDIVYFTIQTPLIDTTPPTISIVSPENKTYDTTDIQLTFTTDESVSWMAYSLDNNANVTITGNTTLSGLPEGPHNLVVYTNDTAGNMGASNMVYFGVETPQPESFPTLIVVAVVVTAGVGATLLVYFKKVKKR